MNAAAPLAWFSRREDALHVKRALSVAGIRTQLGTRGHAPEGWLLGEARGVYLWVREADLQTATALLEALRPVARRCSLF